MSRTDTNGRTTSRHRLVRATVSLFVIAVVLRLGQLKDAMRVAAAGARVTSSAVPATEIETVINISSGYLPFTPSCLVESLVATSLLPIASDPVLRIGVDPSAQTFAAHAWVEVEAEVVVGELPNRDRFHPLPLDGEWP